MADKSPADGGSPRWEYKIVWRYGPLGLVVIGAALLAIGMSGLCAAAVSVAALPVGLVCLLAGAILPRMEGPFSAGPHGLTGKVIPISQLDTYTVTGRALALPPAIEIQGGVTLAKSALRGEGKVALPFHLWSGLPEEQHSESVRLGDVWDALDKLIDMPGGFISIGAATDTRYLEAPDGRTFGLSNRGLLDWGIASGELLSLLASWGVHPVASGKYGKYTASSLRAAGYAVGDVTRGGALLVRETDATVTWPYRPESADAAAGQDDAPEQG